MRITIAVITITVLLNPIAVAQPEAFSIGVSFDPAGTIYEGIVPGFAAPTRLYFLMLNLGEQIVGYENSVEISGPGSEGWVITRGSVVGLDLDSDPDGYVVGIGVCAGTVGQPYQINTYDFAFFDSPQGPMDTLVCARPPTVSNPSIPGFPSYQTCAGALEAATVYPDNVIEPIPDGCAVINCSLGPWCIVPTEQSSWGSLKANY